MKMTSAQAAKLLRKLNDDMAAVRNKEEKTSTFVAAVSEDTEEIRPKYDYDAVNEQMAEIERKIRIVRHAVNVFNTTTVVPETQMTVDEMLVYLPQLTARKKRLEEMAQRMPKERIGASYGSKVIEYTYANYDIDKAAEDYDRVTEELSKAQLALDFLNSSTFIDIDIEL